MKRNMLSVIILTLLVVNLVLTAIMMFSVVGASRKTAKLVDGIAMALDLEVNTSEGEPETVPMTDITPYNILESDGKAMTIPMKNDAEGKPHYCMVAVTLSLNNKHDDFATYGNGDLSAQDGLLKNEIINVFGEYTVEEARDNQEKIKQEILSRIQKLYGSDFIIGVAFSNIVFQ